MQQPYAHMDIQLVFTKVTRSKQTQQYFVFGNITNFLKNIFADAIEVWSWRFVTSLLQPRRRLENGLY